MSGHSKWATTKHKKAVVDAKRGKLFAKLIKTIEVAARTGGGDVSGNPTLADAIAKAKGQSVPNDNIDRAVKRGSGELGDAAAYEEITYEAYGPGGVAVLVECLTDNRNRAAAEVRTAITRNGGNPADPGSVSYLFGRKGLVLITKTDGLTEDDVLLAVLESGAEDVNDLDESFEVVCDATDTHAVRRRRHRRRADRRVGRHRLAAQRERAARGRGRPQGPAPGRRPRGPRRRAERLGQLRRQRRGPRVGLRGSRGTAAIIRRR